MTIVEADHGLNAPAIEQRPRLPARLWSAPVWSHLLALGLVLAALVPLIGTDASFSADEGAAIVQAQSLARGDGWIVEHPLPEVDPTGRTYPLELSEQGPRGSAPFGKHPLYAMALAGADWLGGVNAMVLLSLAGTLAAAGVAGALARRLGPGLVRPTVWVVGLASPLLFDGYLVIAHTLGAALAAAATLAAVVAIERRSWRVALAVAPCIAGAVLLRNEAVFFALALAVTSAVVGLCRSRLAAAAVAGASLLAGAAAYLVDRVWTRAIVGGATVPTGGSVSNGGSGILAGRLRGFLLTWVRPDYAGPRALTLALIAMVAVLAVGALLVRRHPSERGPIVLLSALAAAAAVAGLMISPHNLVPGLVVAFPIVVPGLLLIRRPLFGTATARIAGGTFAIFAAGVIATQYSRGGTAEWGGRYFALGLPVLVPVLLLALGEEGRRLDSVARRWSIGSLAVCSLALVSMGVLSIRATHQFTAELMASIDRAGQQVGGERPVVVTTAPLVPRLSGQTFDRQRWLLSPSSELSRLTEKLRSAGISRFAFVTKDLAGDRSMLPASVRVVSSAGSPDGSSWQVLVLALASDQR